ncbi:c-type cytochrome [Magnetofaba australis]|nr:hypothetical protein [Magnetofaba australis]
MLNAFVVVIALLALPASASAMEPAWKTCDSCHGENGYSTDPNTPILGGMNAYYLKDALMQYIRLRRPDPAQAHAKLDRKILPQLAQRYAELPWKSAPMEKQGINPQRAADGYGMMAKCERCHKNGGQEQYDDNPRLAGQWLPYLIGRIKAFHAPNSTLEQPHKMREFMQVWSADEVESIAHGFASMAYPELANKLRETPKEKSLFDKFKSMF